MQKYLYLSSVDVIWVIITVNECGTLAVTQQLHQLSTQSNDVQMS